MSYSFNGGTVDERNYNVSNLIIICRTRAWGRLCFNNAKNHCSRKIRWVKNGFRVNNGCAIAYINSCRRIIHDLDAVALAFEIIRYLGALYLIYLGLSSFIKKKKSTNKDLTNQTEATNKVRNGSAYKQGLISNILNPKVALFFLTFLPQFVIPGYHASLQFIIMGTIYALFTISWYTTLVYLLAYVRKWLLSPKVQGTIDKITGLALLGFGLNILLNNPSESK